MIVLAVLDDVESANNIELSTRCNSSGVHLQLRLEQPRLSYRCFPWGVCARFIEASCAVRPVGSSCFVFVCPTDRSVMHRHRRSY